MWIDNDLYQHIKHVIPIVCVDCVIQHNNKFLLVKRATEPLKNEWWFVGGRLYLNETLSNCAVRKCKKEVGLDVTIRRQLGVEQTIFDSIHTINILYHVESKSRNVVIDSTISDYMWLNLSDGWQDWYLQIAQNKYINKYLELVK
jgi:ADP-ribose pyrophosphatase YjhB (NUDIX family)